MVVKAEEVTAVPLDKEVKSCHSLIPSQVETGISTLLQLRQRRKDAEGKKTLFHDEAQSILLQFTPIKIPKTSNQELRIPLPHSLHGDSPEVCLITRDMKKGQKKFTVEETVNCYQSRLEKKGITGISQIMPYRQLVDEYKPFELKSRFAFLYDVYLVDGMVYGPATKILGTRFFKRGKHLLPVKMNGKGLKTNIERALTKTVMSVHGNGDSFVVKVADTSFTASQITENIFALVTALCEDNMFPGGFENIRSIYVKTPLSLAIPIYLTLKSGSAVPVPTVAPRLPRAYKVLKGELSTFVGGEVTVYPDGEVEMRKRYTKEDREMGFLSGEDESDSADDEFDDVLPGDDEDMLVSDGEEEAKASDEEEPPSAGKKRKSTAADADSSDDEVEAAEDAYLSEWQKEFQEKIEKEGSDDEEAVEKPAEAPVVYGRPEKPKAGAKSDQAMSTASDNIENRSAKKVKKPKKKKEKMAAVTVAVPKPVVDVQQVKLETKQKKLDGKKKKLEAFGGISSEEVSEKKQAEDKVFKKLDTNVGVQKKVKTSSVSVVAGKSEASAPGKAKKQKQENAAEKKPTLPAFAGLSNDVVVGKKQKIVVPKPTSVVGIVNGANAVVDAAPVVGATKKKKQAFLIDKLLMTAKKAIETPDDKIAPKVSAMAQESATVKVGKAKKRKSDEVAFPSLVDSTTKKTLLKLQLGTENKKVPADVAQGGPVAKADKKAAKAAAFLKLDVKTTNPVAVDGSYTATQRRKDRRTLSSMVLAASPSSDATIVGKKKKAKLDTAALKALQMLKWGATPESSPAGPSPLKTGGSSRYFDAKLPEVVSVLKHVVLEKRKKKAKKMASQAAINGTNAVLKIDSNGDMLSKKTKKTKKALVG